MPLLSEKGALSSPYWHQAVVFDGGNYKCWIRPNLVDAEGGKGEKERGGGNM
jgi:hypothetical protein